jgi:hypothetical protein
MMCNCAALLVGVCGLEFARCSDTGYASAGAQDFCVFYGHKT